MAQDEKTIYVYENWRGEAPTLLGRLRCGFVRGQETFSFEYDPAWLSSAESSFSLDPDLALYRGRQYVPLNKQLFCLFSDSCPDRCGAPGRHAGDYSGMPLRLRMDSPSIWMV